MQKIYIIKHKYYHSHEEIKEKEKNVPALFHYCSHYFSFSLFNPISFMNTVMK